MPAVPADPARGVDPLVFVRYLDVVLLVLATPFVLVLGAPATGYLAGAGGVAPARASPAPRSTAYVARSGDYRTALGLGMASAVLRAWLVGLTILAVGLLAEREDGLTAGVTVLVAFTVYFATALVLRPLERKPPRA